LDCVQCGMTRSKPGHSTLKTKKNPAVFMYNIYEIIMENYKINTLQSIIYCDLLIIWIFGVRRMTHLIISKTGSFYEMSKLQTQLSRNYHKCSCRVLIIWSSLWIPLFECNSTLVIILAILLNWSLRICT